MLGRVLGWCGVIVVGGVFLISAVIALALLGHPSPLGRLVAIAEHAVDAVEEIRNPIAAQDDGGLGDPAHPTITHGVASGEITSTSAVIWTRASAPAAMHVEMDVDPGFASPWVASGAIDPAADFTGRVRINGLQPDTTYTYRVWVSPLGAAPEPWKTEALHGRFRTAPSPEQPTAVTIAFGGDLGGGGYCREVDAGYPIFAGMERIAPTFLLTLGDMIYADNTCPARRPGGGANVPGGFRDIDHGSIDWTDLAQVRPVYWAHWRYNRADPALQRLLAVTPMYVMWDDHEVINDFGASWTSWRIGTEDRAGFPNLVLAGRDALFAYAPLERQEDDPDRLYRSVRWGRDLELFLVDVRSYRSRNHEPDTPERGKTMLGPEQLAWLQRGLSESDATWKVVAAGVSLSVPTGGVGALVYGRDGWANGNGDDPWSRTGFERELVDLIGTLERQRVENLVFVGADIHQPLALRYEVDLDGDGVPFRFHEFLAGPFSATPRRGRIVLDPTLTPTLLFTEGGIFTFGVIRVQLGPDGRSRLMYEARGEDGALRPGSAITLVAERSTSPRR